MNNALPHIALGFILFPITFGIGWVIREFVRDYLWRRSMPPPKKNHRVRTAGELAKDGAAKVTQADRAPR